MEEKGSIKGIVFNIQPYSIHDGPGIRTTVFVKGCPLRCLWCQNPESQLLQPQLLYNIEKCVGCGLCVPACPNGAIRMENERSVTNRNLCTGCGECAAVCPTEARTIAGEEMTAEAVFKRVAADDIFYKGSGGGVTISGGEAFVQADFVASILQLSKEAGIHTAVETCGYAAWQTMKRVLQHVDLVLFDMKHMDSAEHKKLTGVGNELILENLKKIYHELKIPVAARVPVIPGCNDSLKNIEATAQFVARELGTDVKVHLLPYHRLGQSKSAQLEVGTAESDFSTEPPSNEHMEKLQKIVQFAGLTAIIGG